MSSNQCPKCSAEEDANFLAPCKIEIDGGKTVELDCCAACGGAWCHMKTLSETLASMEMGLELPNDPKLPVPGYAQTNISINCPECKGPTLEFCYPTTAVLIDYCAECCSLWLDKGELRALATSFRFRKKALKFLNQT